ncbi:hypothetical protein [Rubritalea sp.]|uniref:hypothetical protein n=1 Tax=Rubritalea sp. TaxID=2109375 RepID=UPI003EF0A1A5
MNLIIKKGLTVVSFSVLSLLLTNCNDTPSAADSSQVLEINKGKALVLESIAAHGGTDKWYNNGLLNFRWTYHMTDRGPKAIVDTKQTVDSRTLDVVHEVPDSDVKFGLSKGEAWISPLGSNFKPPVRFWSLTPYYFLGIPFVFNDDNAQFELLAETKEFEGKEYSQVRVTYGKEAGDSPDDYYVLLIDNETKLTRGAYYIVTNKLVAPNGPTPEKFITLDDLTDINGVMLAGSHRTMSMDNGVIGEQMRHADVSEVKFLPRGSVDLGIPNPELIIKSDSE